MSPQDALRRITSTFVLPRRDFSTVARPRSDSESKLASIAAEIDAIRIDDTPFVAPAAKPHTRRDVAEALRLYAPADALALFVGFMASWFVATAANLLYFSRDLPLLTAESFVSRLVPYGVISLGVLLWFGRKGHYRVRQPFWMETQQIVSAFGAAMLIDGFIQFASKLDFSRLWLISSWMFAGATVLLLRHLLRRALRRMGLWQIRTLLVGSGATADEARAALRSEPTLGYEIVMQVENVLLLLKQTGGSWEKLCARFNADYILIALDGPALAEAEAALNGLSRETVPYSVSPPLTHLPVLSVAPQYFFSRNVLLMAPTNNLEQPLPRFLKRAIDLVGSGLGLIMLSPVFAVIALWVKSDGGPVFYGDARVGLNGKMFSCLKFRSMVMDPDALLWDYLDKNPDKKREWKTFHKLRGDNDPRVTRIGRFLRRWSLDELPQLINVLRGDMSLVGPRPIMFRERNVYSEDLTHYCRVRPGLTGIWQVSGRSDVSFARRVQMDIWYVRNWSLWHDMAILCKTFPAILNKTGAY